MTREVRGREKVEEIFSLCIEAMCWKANIREQQQTENTSRRKKWKLSMWLCKAFLVPV